MLRIIDGMWCNVSAKPLHVRGRIVRLWNLYHRRSTEGHWWGVGILQIDRRHLFFVGRTQGYDDQTEVWAVSVLFLSVTP